jgi:hypothetical protein
MVFSSRLNRSVPCLTLPPIAHNLTVLNASAGEYPPLLFDGQGDAAILGADGVLKHTLPDEPTVISK